MRRLGEILVSFYTSSRNSRTTVCSSLSTEYDAFIQSKHHRIFLSLSRSFLIRLEYTSPLRNRSFNCRKMYATRNISSVPSKTNTTHPSSTVILLHKCIILLFIHFRKSVYTSNSTSQFEQNNDSIHHATPLIDHRLSKS